MDLDIRSHLILRLLDRNKSSPCCRLCMFQSDHLHFLEREDGIGWVWLVLASCSPSHRQNPDLATLPAVVGEYGEQREVVGKDVGKQRKEGQSWCEPH